MSLILMAIGMAISVLVEVLLPGGGITMARGKPRPEDEKGLKERIRIEQTQCLGIATGEIRHESC